VSFIAAGRNSLEAPAIRLAPIIADVLGALLACDDCAVARLSGSGATCFGLFDTTERAEEAASRLTRLHPDWWIVATTLS
jgi:4-diphosphocytidyl-2-C-methyl-D-erythritol kinase